MLKSTSLNNLIGVKHAFFTRHGGVSSGIYASLNCGTGSSDDASCVVENKRRAANHFELAEDQLITLCQIHSSEVITLADPAPIRSKHIEADAMVTRTPGIALGILTADCAPVLFADPKARVIGAAHAGWRGALGGVIENTISGMESLGATRQYIQATVGPCIAQTSYQVGADFPDQFIKNDPSVINLFRPDGDTGKHLFDLQGFLLRHLKEAGLFTPDALDMDTYTTEDLFFSYRRTCHRGEDDYGRGLSAIALTEV